MPLDLTWGMISSGEEELVHQFEHPKIPAVRQKIKKAVPKHFDFVHLQVENSFLCLLKHYFWPSFLQENGMSGSRRAWEHYTGCLVNVSLSYWRVNKTLPGSPRPHSSDVGRAFATMYGTLSFLYQKIHNEKNKSCWNARTQISDSHLDGLLRGLHGRSEQMRWH